MHSDLLLGSVGRYYSELAASWMWVAAVSGIFLWLQLGRRRDIKTTNQKQTQNTKNGFIRSRTRHANIAIYTRYQSRCFIQSLAWTARQGVT